MVTQSVGTEETIEKPKPRWHKWATVAGGLLVALAAFVRFGSHLIESQSLPDCDSRRAKDTLSDVFKEKQLKPTSYSEVKTLSSSKDTVDCEAILPVDDQNVLDVKYSFFWKDSAQQIRYTIENKPK